MVDMLVNSLHPRTNPEAAPALVVQSRLPRRRLPVAERERQIVTAAISYFAEHGFAAQLRDLASAIGVTHTLVYHYFPTKQALVDRVYLEVIAGRWKPEWEKLLDDSAIAVPEKLVHFYGDYARTVLTREFVRILVFSGLTDRSITDRFFNMLSERLFPRLIRETRRFRGSRSRAKPSAREHELLMGLHGGVFYGGLRRFVYDHDIGGKQALDDESLIADRVHSYLNASRSLAPTGPATRITDGDPHGAHAEPLLDPNDGSGPHTGFL
jgi:AcrR family transcriptional regulator